MIEFKPSDMAKKQMAETEARKKRQGIPKEKYQVPMTDKQVDEWERVVKEAEKISKGESNPAYLSKKK